MNTLFPHLLWIIFIACSENSKPDNTDIIFTDSVINTVSNNDTTARKKSDTSFLDFAAVGDIMLGTNFPDNSTLPNNPESLLKPADSLLLSADVTFGNAEGVFLNNGGESKGFGPNVYNFRQPEAYATLLKNSGFDFLSIANNHVYDFGAIGMNSTTKVLKNAGFAIAGTPANSFDIIEKNGLKIGMVAFAPHKGCLDLNDLPAVEKLVREVKRQCDILLVSFHAGAEGSKATHVPRKHEFFYDQDRGDVYEAAHAVIDAGADIVIGHGPHVPRALELYKSKLIAYSLGNFCTYAKFNLKGISGYAPLIKFRVNEKGEFTSGRIYSFLQLGEGGPVPDENHSSAKLISKLSVEDFPESKLHIDEVGNITIK